MVLQEGVIYARWLSREAEEVYKAAVPGVEPRWDDERRETGALEAKEEHVDLVWVFRGSLSGPYR